MRKVALIHHSGKIGGAGVSLLQTVNLLKKILMLKCFVLKTLICTVF